MTDRAVSRRQLAADELDGFRMAGTPAAQRIRAAAFRWRIATARGDRAAVAALGWLAPLQSSGYQHVVGRDGDALELDERIERLDLHAAQQPRAWRRSLRMVHRQRRSYGTENVPRGKLSIADQVDGLERAVGLLEVAAW